jgi:fusion and transport protein UGO1
MATQSEGVNVNPLRPYYIPPTIGESLDHGSSSMSGGVGGAGGSAGVPGNATSAGAQYACKARDMLNDLDYNHYLGDDTPSMMQSVRSLLDELLWKYTSVLMAQPFEVAKMILQTRSQDGNVTFASPLDPDLLKKRSGSGLNPMYDVSSKQLIVAWPP